MLFRMCRAYADCGSLFFMYRICSRCLFVRSLFVCPMYALLHVLQTSLYTPHLLCSWVLVLLFRLGKLLYCVSATQGNFYICMFEEIGYFPDFRVVISEGGPFSVFFFSCNC